MVVVLSILILLFAREDSIVPNRWSQIIELAYGHWQTVVKDNLGKEGVRIFPAIFSLFITLVLFNLLGLCPYVFTVPVHIAITFGISFSIIIAVTIMGVLKFKWQFLSMLMPMGAPMGLAPLLVLIETTSYVSRAISLGIRLAANLTAGHLLLAIIAGFCFTMVVNGMLLLSVFPLLILIFISILEMAVAVIQAYVFCLLTTIYFSDTIALH